MIMRILPREKVRDAPYQIQFLRMSKYRRMRRFFTCH